MKVWIVVNGPGLGENFLPDYGGGIVVIAEDHEKAVRLAIVQAALLNQLPEEDIVRIIQKKLREVPLDHEHAVVISGGD